MTRFPVMFFLCTAYCIVVHIMIRDRQNIGLVGVLQIYIRAASLENQYSGFRRIKEVEGLYYS